MKKPTVFISYARKDAKWKDRLLDPLRALEQAGRLIVWDDQKIRAGDKWYPEIQKAIDDSSVAVCLISSLFLASKFISEEEVPYLLGHRNRGRLALVSILLTHCPWTEIQWLKETQILPGNSLSIKDLTPANGQTS